MSKIAAYLQGHLQGEVLIGPRARMAYSRDASVLAKTPEAVVLPYDTQDIRKVARFSSQLAEKGHILPVTPRGNGQNTTGSAISNGIIVDMTKHMNHILEVDSQQRIARVQPGVSAAVLNEALFLHGLCFPPLLYAKDAATLGGVIASGDMQVGDWIEQLEVVLPNGETIQTGRLSKKEVNKRKGVTNFEGSIYREVDGIITDDLEAEEATGDIQSSSYNVSEVRQKDGSFDLLPLFIGSQGTLGIISEVIIKLAPYSPATETMIVACSSLEAAHDALSSIEENAVLRVMHLGRSEMAFAAKQHGIVYDSLIGEDNTPPAALVMVVVNGADRAQRKVLKKLAKTFSTEAYQVLRSDNFDLQRAWRAIFEQTISAIGYDETNTLVPVPCVGLVAVPLTQFEQYHNGLAEIAAKHHIVIHSWAQDQATWWHIRPLLDLRRLTDRQKIFRFIDDYMMLVQRISGRLVLEGDGLLLAPFLAKYAEASSLEMRLRLKKIFDPYMIANTDVKLLTDPKKLVPLLADDYSPYR